MLGHDERLMVKFNWYSFDAKKAHCASLLSHYNMHFSVFCNFNILRHSFGGTQVRKSISHIRFRKRRNGSCCKVLDNTGVDGMSSGPDLVRRRNKNQKNKKSKHHINDQLHADVQL